MEINNLVVGQSESVFHLINFGFTSRSVIMLSFKALRSDEGKFSIGSNIFGENEFFLNFRNLGESGKSIRKKSRELT